MKKLCTVTLLAVLALIATSAAAESLANRFAVTGRIGVLFPSDSEIFEAGGAFNLDTDVSFIGGGGFLYGIDRSFVAEIDVTHTEFDANIGGGKAGSFGTTNISLGGQYRFDIDRKEFSPYAGGGLDILVNDFEAVNGQVADVDTVVGVHICGGIDYFLQHQLALTAEGKLVLAPDADINSGGVKVGNYDPLNFNLTFGVRYFFN